MKILIIGLGSMGQRRFRLAKKICDTNEFAGVEQNPDRADSVSKELGIPIYQTIQEAYESFSPDCAFVCSSPLSHAYIIAELMNLELPVFSELNLVNTGYELFIPQEKENKLFLSSTFLYRRDIRYIIEAFGNQRASYVYHSGQYLADWHPWESYKSYFVGDKRTNGCREIMAIEFPWLIEAFGDIESVCSSSCMQGDLDLPYPDTFQIQVTHASGTVGVIVIDVVSYKPSRHFEAWTVDKHIRWDGVPESLAYWDKDKTELIPINTYNEVNQDVRYSKNIIEDAYEDEIRAFFSMVKDSDSDLVKYSYAKDARVLALIDEIEGV